MNDAAFAVEREFVRTIDCQDVDAWAALMTPDHTFTDSLASPNDQP